MTSTLGVLSLDDLVPADGSMSDADTRPRPTQTKGEWTVRVDDATAISVSGLPGVPPGTDDLSVDDRIATYEQDELPDVSNDASLVATSVEGAGNWTRVDSDHIH